LKFDLTAHVKIKKLRSVNFDFIAFLNDSYLWLICITYSKNIFRDTDFENFYPIGSDRVVISRFRTFEILWISRVMPKSNHLWWRHCRSIMMSSEVKLVWHPKFWVELSFAIKIFEFRSSRISLDLFTWGLLFNFQNRTNQSKIAQIHNPKGVFS